MEIVRDVETALKNEDLFDEKDAVERLVLLQLIRALGMGTTQAP